MSDGEPEQNQLASDIFEYEVRASAATTDLFEQFEQGVAVEAMVEEFQKVVNKLDDPDMQKSATMVMAQVGRGVGSQKMINAAQQFIDHSDELDVE